MEYSHIVNAVSNMVELSCMLPSNKFGVGIWDNHIIEVVKFAEILAIQSGALRDVVALAALLHDYSCIVDYSHYEDHHIHSMNMAEGILKSLGYPEDRIARVKEAIYTHRGSRTLPTKSLEGRCVANADAMAHIARFETLIAYAREERGLNDVQSLQFVSDKIARSWRKMHVSVKKLFEPYYLRATAALKVAA